MKSFIPLIFLILCFFYTETEAQDKVDTRRKSIYPVVSYEEPYRNQFHFSPKVGWMNDINGPLYYDGVYHMFFQHYPYGNQWANMHWGYATSKDLLYWTQHNPALVPGKNGNTKGMAYSGTAIIDSLNTSGLQTGKHPVFILPYTDTAEGQSLAYSNDLGKTWVRFKDNPVISKPDEDEKPMTRRDPKVFWYAPKQHWVMVVFREKVGMEFFASKNLRDWEYKNTFNAKFFWECPDMFQMEVEGTQEKKWVLMAAIGAYCVGDFNGESFTKETQVQKMYLGPDIYAGQSFYNAPNNKIIQMAWLGMWNRKLPILNNLLWNHAASFPVELTLHKNDSTYRIHRNPIKNIQKLVKENIVHKKITVDNHSKNLNVNAFKTYDLEFTIDVSKTLTDSLELQISNKTVLLNLKDYIIDGINTNSKIKQINIRILKDIACYELFINTGTYSKAEEFAFDDNDNTLLFKTSNPITITQFSLKELGSIWH